MSIFRSNEINEDNYCKIPKEIFYKTMDDVNLSCKAKGMFTFMLSNPNKLYSEHDFISPKDKIDSITSGLNNLIENGYVEKITNGILGYKIKGMKVDIIEGNNSGFVYVIYDSLGNYKIGYAQNILKRIKFYYTLMPNKPIVIKTIACTDMRKAERFLHDKFKSKRLNGEWFKLNEEDLQYINRLEGDFYEPQF